MCLSFDLKTGVTLAIFSCDGTIPVSRVLLKICERTGAISFIIDLSSLVLMLSIPLLLLDLSFLVIFIISSGLVGFRNMVFFSFL